MIESATRLHNLRKKKDWFNFILWDNFVSIAANKRGQLKKKIKIEWILDNRNMQRHRNREITECEREPGNEHFKDIDKLCWKVELDKHFENYLNWN